MGFAVGRYTRILHVRLCDSSYDSDTGLEHDTTAGQIFRKQHDSFHVDGGITAYPAVSASAYIGRQRRLEFFSYAAGVFIAGNINHHVYISPEST